ncbi:hypothetical protein C0991_006677 [Blastosporella zonata]|nr:hypothetical protein C0991_006677 [Blastosporella zonata]
MSPTVPTNDDQALSHSSANAVPQQPPQQQSMGMLPPGFEGLDQARFLSLVQSLPGLFTKIQEGKEDAAQTLQALSTQPTFPGGPGTHYPGPHPGGLPGINDPGPSSHPRGPPNLGQLSAVAMSAAPAQSRPSQLPGHPQEMEEASEDDRRGQMGGGSQDMKPASPGATTARGRGARSATMGSDEWSRQRKDNHKEVERRRRGNINDGINELGRIVPNGSGEKAKGAILSRAVQYIHHLKENEARNIEKWTLEKLLMDQAMGDLQTQLEEMKKMWEDERNGRMRAEVDRDALRNVMGQLGGQQQQQEQGQGQGQPIHARSDSESLKRGVEAGDADNDGKKQRVE